MTRSAAARLEASLWRTPRVLSRLRALCLGAACRAHNGRVCDMAAVGDGLASLSAEMLRYHLVGGVPRTTAMAPEVCPACSLTRLQTCKLASLGLSNFSVIYVLGFCVSGAAVNGSFEPQRRLLHSMNRQLCMMRQPEQDHCVTSKMCRVGIFGAPIPSTVVCWVCCCIGRGHAGMLRGVSAQRACGSGTL